MKKILKYITFSMLTALVMASCKGSETGVEKETGINFSATNVTKGTPITGPTIPDRTSFGVYAYLLPTKIPNTPGDESFVTPGYSQMDNIEVKFENSKCTYKNTKYWPTNSMDLLMFFAYYPFGGAGITTSRSTENTNAYIDIQYKMDLNPIKHLDLMYAQTTPLDRVNVHMQLQHALTRLTFSAKLGEEPEIGQTISIKEVNIKKITTIGTLRVSDRNGVWTPSPDAADKKDLLMSLGNGFIENVELNTTDFKPLLTTQVGELMVIPQDVKKLYFEVVFLVDLGGGNIVEEKNNFLVPEEHPWEKAKYIHYKFNITKDALLVYAETEGWDTAGTGGEVIGI